MNAVPTGKGNTRAQFEISYTIFRKINSIASILEQIHEERQGI
jgi:hypothetical protein